MTCIKIKYLLYSTLTKKNMPHTNIQNERTSTLNKVMNTVTIIYIQRTSSKDMEWTTLQPILFLTSLLVLGKVEGCILHIEAAATEIIELYFPREVFPHYVLDGL